jgi:hypothetical protein
MITYEWLEELNCTLCNPARAPGLASGGVRVTGPEVAGSGALCICEECLGVLDSMAYVDRYERPHAPQALAALGVPELGQQTKVRVRRATRAAPSQSLSHRSGLVVALKHLAHQWTARADQLETMRGRLTQRKPVHAETAGEVKVLSETLRYCAREAVELAQPTARTAVISDYPKDAPCAATNE